MTLVSSLKWINTETELTLTWSPDGLLHRTIWNRGNCLKKGGNFEKKILGRWLEELPVYHVYQFLTSANQINGPYHIAGEDWQWSQMVNQTAEEEWKHLFHWEKPSVLFFALLSIRKRLKAINLDKSTEICFIFRYHYLLSFAFKYKGLKHESSLYFFVLFSHIGRQKCAVNNFPLSCSVLRIHSLFCNIWVCAQLM